MTSVDKKLFLRQVRWQAVWRWWHRDLPAVRVRMDAATYRAVKRRQRARARREAWREAEQG